MRSFRFPLCASLALVCFGFAACGGSERPSFDPPASPPPEPSEQPPGFVPPATLDAGSPPPCVEGDCERACADAAAAKGATGCEFYVPLPRTWAGLSANRFETSCFAAFVTNTFERPVQITLEHRGEKVDGSEHARIPSGSGRSMKYDPLPYGLLPAGQVAIVFLSGVDGGAVTCPGGVVPFARDTAPGCANCLDGKNEAFHVRTSAPVGLVDIFPYGGGTSAVTGATSLLPIASWGLEYIAVDGYDGMSGSLPWTSIVAKEDATEVRVIPRSTLERSPGFVGIRPANVETSYVLRKGQVLLLQAEGPLTGSPIIADKPVGAFFGHDCANIPESVQACDSVHQTLPPVSTVGNAYAVVRPRDRYAGRVESAPVRLVGLAPDTSLVYTPYKPAGAPAALVRGESIEFRADAPFFVSSQDKEHPFYALSYMTSCEEYGPPDDCRGDPELLTVVTPAQFETRSSFFTDPTYPETHLVVVRSKKDGAFAPVTLDCAGELDGWMSLGSVEYMRLDLVGGNFQKRGACDNGRHDMTSTAPFGVSVWGWGSAATGPDPSDPNDRGFYSEYVSYAYSASVGARAINSVPAMPR